jgi:hypothetical protein
MLFLFFFFSRKVIASAAHRPETPVALRPPQLIRPKIVLPEEELDNLFLDVDAQERLDLDVISELARAGRPDVGKILDEEIFHSKGRILVSVCGPTALNNLVREQVAKRIDPMAVLRGDPRAHLEMVGEDFSF